MPDHKITAIFDGTASRPLNPHFQVDERPVLLTAGGMDGDTATVEVLCRVDNSNTHWVPLIRNGVAVELSDDNVQHYETAPGSYRVISASTTGHIAALQTDIDNLSWFTLQQFAAGGGSAAASPPLAAISGSAPTLVFTTSASGIATPYFVGARVDEATGTMSYFYVTQAGAEIPGLPPGTITSTPPDTGPMPLGTFDEAIGALANAPAGANRARLQFQYAHATDVGVHFFMPDSSSQFITGHRDIVTLCSAAEIAAFRSGLPTGAKIVAYYSKV